MAEGGIPGRTKAIVLGFCCNQGRRKPSGVSLSAQGISLHKESQFCRRIRSRSSNEQGRRNEKIIQ